MSYRFLLILLALLSATGCASTTSQSDATFNAVTNPNFAAIQTVDDKFEKDKLAVLAMRGDYQVDFHFTETVRLQPGYEIHDDKNAGALETVIVVEDSADRVILQHILVMGEHVIKHWRQDWIYEAPQRFEFVEDQTWQLTDIPPEKTAGAWTQCVYEVSDAPRYCGTGKWNHRYGVSTWTSDRTWRPLPRREYTKRDDYNALNVENRHTITSHGWTHEQDNTKTVRDARETARTLVREFGFNNYRSIEGYDFSPAADYWHETSDYWARVRDAWQRRLTTNEPLRLKTGVDGMEIISATFEQADSAATTSADEQRLAIKALLDEWTENTVPVVGQSRQ